LGTHRDLEGHHIRFTISRTSNASGTPRAPHRDALWNTTIDAEPSYDNADEQWVIDVGDLAALLILAEDAELIVTRGAQRDTYPHIEIYDDYRE